MEQPGPRPVRLTRAAASTIAESVAERASDALPAGGAPELVSAIRLAGEVRAEVPDPMDGRTLELWEALATLGAVDLTLARVAEPHLDALAILAQARRHGEIDESDWRERSTEWQATPLWQVYAAEGSGRLRARAAGPGWRLTGPKPWCSLAEHATYALVTAWVDDEHRGLFAVDLAADGVTREAESSVSGQSGVWASRGLTQVQSTGILLDDVHAVAVGSPGWYLTRPGFAWGGAGVAAIWYGATVALARTLRASATRRTPDQVALLHLGAVDTALWRARSVLESAAAVADDPLTPEDESEHVAGVVRQVVADAAEEVLHRVGHALGPAPLTGDEDHARRVADLTVYLRQHHAERDLAVAGQRVVNDPSGWSWW